MRKSTIFISAVLTTFALVMLYRVAAAYSDNRNTTTAAAPTSLPAATATQPPADIQANAALGPVEAAQLAAKVISNTGLLSAESSNYNGTNAYKVTFTNNDVVYVGLDGQILSVQAAPVTPAAPVVVNVAPPTKSHKNQSSGGSTSSPSGGSYEGGGEHEGGDD